MNRPRFSCTLCPKTFATPKEVKGHFAEKHTENKPFGFKTFSTKRNIGLHTMIHTGERPYKCSYCDKRFIQHHHRSGHERIPTWERPFKCTQCDKSLYDSANFSKNIIIHDQKKIFDCKPCDVSFARKAQLKGHNLTHHTDSDEKNFPCPNCSKERNIFFSNIYLTWIWGRGPYNRNFEMTR